MRSRAAALSLVLAASLAGCGDPAPERSPQLTGSSLVEELREGGHVFFLRHTETARGGIDSVNTLGDCSAQRPLTDQGRQDARELGAALERLDIPIGDVVASPFCRTLETAQLAFGRAEPDDALLALASVGGDGSSAQERTLDAVRALALQDPADGTNTVLVGHVSTIGPLTGVSPAEGATVVVRAVDGELTVVAEVQPGGWEQLAEEVGRPAGG